MTRSVLSAGLVVLASGLLAQVAQAQVFIGIDVSPRILNVSSNGNRVTVHTDVPFEFVDDSQTVLLSWQGESSYQLLPALEIRADVSGNLMAKFSARDIKADILPGLVDMTLSGVLLSGDPFLGFDTICVIKRGGNRGG